MNACEFISKKKNYLGLTRRAMAVIKGHSREEAFDIVADAMLYLLQTFKKKPESLEKIEKMGEEDMRRFLGTCLIRRVYTLLKKKNRMQKKIAEYLSDGFEEEKEKLNVFNLRSIWNANIRIYRKLEKLFGTVTVDIDEFRIKEFREDIALFFDAKFGSEKRKLKEEAIDLYIERFQKKLTIPQLQEIYPEKNVPSLNSEACRLIKNYLGWLRAKGVSNLFKFEEINGQET